jgi:hypothetical protein
VKTRIDQIQENARMIDDIADCLLDDHIELMNETAALRAENETLREERDEARSLLNGVLLDVDKLQRLIENLRTDRGALTVPKLLGQGVNK